ncbi:UNVERIFIED_CONTAM: hypothetical protein Cloal_1155 [Acetivibrio alkalicellulosi]
MDKLKVTVVYPDFIDLESKDLELTQCELMGLMMSNKMGSEGKYFKIQNKIFEDTKSGYCLTIILEDEDIAPPFMGNIEPL